MGAYYQTSTESPPGQVESHQVTTEAGDVVFELRQREHGLPRLEIPGFEGFFIASDELLDALGLEDIRPEPQNIREVALARERQADSDREDTPAEPASGDDGESSTTLAAVIASGGILALSGGFVALQRRRRRDTSQD